MHQSEVDSQPFVYSHQGDMESPKLPLLLPENTAKKDSLPNFLFKSYWNNVLLVLSTAAVLNTASNLCLKVLNEDVSYFQICFVRAIISVPILVPVSYYQSGMIIGPKESLKKVLLRGFLCALGFYCLAASFKYLTVSDATLLSNTHPVFVTLVAWVIGSQKMNKLAVVGVIGTILAVVLIAKPPFMFGGDDEAMDTDRVVGIVIATMGSFLRSLGFVVIGKIGTKVPSLVVANHAVFFLSIMSFPFLFTSFPKELNLNVSWYDVVLYLGAATASLNQIFVVRGFQIGTPVQAAILMLVRVLMGVLTGIAFMSDDVTIYLVLGTIILLFSIGLVTMPKLEKKENSLPLIDKEQGPSRRPSIEDVLSSEGC